MNFDESVLFMYDSMLISPNKSCLDSGFAMNLVFPNILSNALLADGFGSLIRVFKSPNVMKNCSESKQAFRIEYMDSIDWN